MLFLTSPNICFENEINRKHIMDDPRRIHHKFVLRSHGTSVLHHHHRHTVRTAAFQDDHARSCTVRQEGLVTQHPAPADKYIQGTCSTFTGKTLQVPFIFTPPVAVSLEKCNRWNYTTFSTISGLSLVILEICFVPAPKLRFNKIHSFTLSFIDN